MTFLDRLERRIVFALDRVIGTGEDPKSLGYPSFNRRWVWAPSFGFTKRDSGPTIWFGVSHWLAQFDGRPVDPPRPGPAAHLQIRFFDWKIRREHIYYDGPNCFYQVGPFAIDISGRDCKTCQERA